MNGALKQRLPYKVFVKKYLYLNHITPEIYFLPQFYKILKTKNHKA